MTRAERALLLAIAHVVTSPGEEALSDLHQAMHDVRAEACRENGRQFVRRPRRQPRRVTTTCRDCRLGYCDGHAEEAN